MHTARVFSSHSRDLFTLLIIPADARTATAGSASTARRQSPRRVEKGVSTRILDSGVARRQRVARTRATRVDAVIPFFHISLHCVTGCEAEAIQENGALRFPYSYSFIVETRKTHSSWLPRQTITRSRPRPRGVAQPVPRTSPARSRSAAERGHRTRVPFLPRSRS